jgi:hypothetical protein
MVAVPRYSQSKTVRQKRAVVLMSLGIGVWATTGFAQDPPRSTSGLPADVNIGDRLWVLGQSGEATCEVTEVET